MNIKGIPSNEQIWVREIDSSGDIYYITAKNSRDCYYLYKENNGVAVKVGKGETPNELERKYIK